MLMGSAAQFDAAACDPNVAALSDDSQVHGTMAVTTASTGASQLWNDGRSNFGGLTGHGVTVVIIDSGVDRGHPDIKSFVTHANSPDNSTSLSFWQ